MNINIIVRLSIMMFLQFFVWGAWYVTVGNYMKQAGMGESIGNAYTVGPLAAIIAPLFLGLVADRYFATERVLAVMHICGGLAICLAPGQTGTVFVGILLLHMLCYMPTLGLTNTLAFHNIRNQEKEFPIVRVAGTIGWIAANTVVSKVLQADTLPSQFYIAGGAAIVLGLYSLTLPHTAPPAKGQPASIGSILGFDSIKLMSKFSFAVFILSSFLICIPLSAYYAYAPVFVNDAGLANPGWKMSFGQWSEVVFMLIMPIFFSALGVKWMLLFGMLAWVVRYGLFAAAAPGGVPALIVLGILLHGICYDFFFVTGQIYVDKQASKQIRGQAQGFLVLVTQGLGMLIGAQISQAVFNSSGATKGALTLAEWRHFWLLPCIAAGVVMVAFGLLFRDASAPSQITEGDVGEAALAQEGV
jgi:nucleoside transporter